ncbi:MAG TPA: extracellular solute-binding protein [Candidatus Acidoferrales bacterium]|nr:extracellular solute-binding protein [Candidatus Acidoferrales bacterium]
MAHKRCDLQRVRRALKHLCHALAVGLALAALVLESDAGAQDAAGKAKEERKIVLYHTTTVPDTQKIIEGFKKKYPFLDVETYRATGEKLLQKIVTEVKGGRHPADVYVLSALQTWMLKDMGLLAPYASAEREKVAPALKDKQGYWTGVYWNLEVLGYNTKLVLPGQVPAKWEDLLQPRWKGQIGLEEEDVQWYASILQLMGEEKGKDFMRRLAKQQPQIRAGHTLLVQLLTAGEFALGPTTRAQSAEQMKDKGAPIDWTAIEPLAPNPPVSVSLPKSAARPSAAKLFVDFILSREGQTIVYELKRSPTRTDLSQPVPRVAKVKLMEVDHDRLAKNYNRYAQEFREIFSIR